MIVTEHEPATTSTLDEETRRVLAKAKGLLAGGWCQGAYRRGDSYCVIGAVRAAHGESTSMGCPHSEWVARVVAALEELVGASVNFWNDKSGRTVDDVIGLIDRALQQ